MNILMYYQNMNTEFNQYRQSHGLKCGCGLNKRFSPEPTRLCYHLPGRNPKVGVRLKLEFGVN